MQLPTLTTLKTIIDAAGEMRDRLAGLDAGKVSTRLVGGAVILTASFLVVADPHAPKPPESSAVVSARIAPVGTVLIADAPAAEPAR
jgi:hypothetical protein